MNRPVSRLVSLMAAAAVILAVQMPAVAAPIPSKIDQDAVTASPEPEVFSVESFLARQDVADALAAHGWTPDQIEVRIARLTDEDLRDLSRNIAQIQSAGEEVPEYIWWLAGGLLGVLILAAIF